MSFFSNLFQKLFGAGKENSQEDVFATLKKAQQHKNFVAVAKAYYSIGKMYLDQGQKEKALLYINRFDALSGSQDAICEKIPEEMADQAADWIEMLEEEDRELYMNELRAQAGEMGEMLSDMQKIQWNLLSLARFEALFAKLSALKGFSVLANYSKVVEILAQSLYRPVTEEEKQILQEHSFDFYPFTDSSELADVTNSIPVAGGADMEAYDIIGYSTLLNMMTVIDDLIDMAEGKSEAKDMDVDFVINSLIADYYIRTGETELRNIPAVKKETDRIFADFDFVKSAPDKDNFLERMKQNGKVLIPEA